MASFVSMKILVLILISLIMGYSCSILIIVMMF